jgi:hypothetical protein
VLQNFAPGNCRRGGATVVDNLEIANIDVIMDPDQSGEDLVMLAEFKETINKYFRRACQISCEITGRHYSFQHQ